MKWAGTANSYTTHFVDETKICIPNKLHSIHLSDLLRSSLNSSYLISVFSHLTQNWVYNVFTTMSTLKRKALGWSEGDFFVFRFLCIINRRRCVVCCLDLRSIFFLFKSSWTFFCFLLRSYFRFDLDNIRFLLSYLFSSFSSPVYNNSLCEMRRPEVSSPNLHYDLLNSKSVCLSAFLYPSEIPKLYLQEMSAEET